MATKRTLLYILGAALVLAAALGGFLREKKPGEQSERDRDIVTRTSGNSFPGPAKDAKAPRDAKRPPRLKPKEEVAEEEIGYNYGVYIAEKKGAPLKDLLEELESLRSRLSDIAFYKVMEMLGISSHYTPEDKAVAFNRFLPILPILPDGALPVGGIYQAAVGNWGRSSGVDEALGKKMAANPENAEEVVRLEMSHRKWGMIPENRDAIFRFIGALDSPELRKNLTINYYQSAAEARPVLQELIKEESDLSRKSFLGDDYRERSWAVTRVIESLYLGNHISKAEAVDLIKSLEISEEFEGNLLTRLDGKDLP